MAKQDFIPNGDADFLAWHDHFKAQLTTLQGTFGLTDSEVAVSGDNVTAHTKSSASLTAKAAAQAATQDWRTARQSLESKARTLVRRLKAHPNYTGILGEQMGVEGAEDETDLSGAKPTLTVDDRQAHQVVIRFDKSVSDGVNLYCQRGNETAFTFLARDTESPYVDMRPCLGNAPEVRQYRAVYVLHDGEVGLMSDIVQAVCQL